MYHLIGLAFTSPTVVVPAIDGSKYRVHLYDGAISLLKEFVTPSLSTETRKAVVLLTSTHDLKQVQGITGVHAFLLFDDPAVLNLIEGINVLDCQLGPSSQGWRKIKFRPDQLNALLSVEPNGEEPVLPEVVQVAKAAAAPATLRDLMRSALSCLPDDAKAPVELSIAEFSVGILNKRGWTSKVVKPLKNASSSMEAIVELERYCNQSKEGDALWRAFYDHAENGLSIDDASARYPHSDKDDLKYVVTLVPPQKGIKYYLCPRDFPYTVG